MSSFNMQMEYKKTGFLVVYVSGSLDSDHYLELEEKVLDAIGEGLQTLVFDIAGLSYISSMGISALLKVKKAVEELHGKFMLVNPQPQVRKVFEIVKALPFETIFRNIEEADAYLSKIQRDETEKGK